MPTTLNKPKLKSVTSAKFYTYLVIHTENVQLIKPKISITRTSFTTQWLCNWRTGN